MYVCCRRKKTEQKRTKQNKTEQNGSVGRNLQRPSLPTALALQGWPAARTHHWGHCPNASWALTGTGQHPAPQETCCSVWAPSHQRNVSRCPVFPTPAQLYGVPLRPVIIIISVSPRRRDQCLPLLHTSVSPPWHFLIHNYIGSHVAFHIWQNINNIT